MNQIQRDRIAANHKAPNTVCVWRTEHRNGSGIRENVYIATTNVLIPLTAWQLEQLQWRDSGSTNDNGNGSGNGHAPTQSGAGEADAEKSKQFTDLLSSLGIVPIS